MNQFITASNQSVLWKVVNNVAQVKHYFANAPPGTKEKWFQTHIGQMYQMYYGKSEPLQTLNKKAIDIMLLSLEPVQAREPVQIREPIQIREPVQFREPQVMQLPGQAIKTATMDEFSRRQAEYDMMVNKQTPVANFTEPIKDEAIIDINSAVEQYKKQREPIELQVEEIPTKSEEKHVQWGINQEHDHFETRILNAITNIEKDIAEIKAQLLEIKQSKDNSI